MEMAWLSLSMRSTRGWQLVQHDKEFRAVEISFDTEAHGGRKYGIVVNLSSTT